jgi:NitT/TauT family transport system ATP-binding protein
MSEFALELIDISVTFRSGRRRTALHRRGRHHAAHRAGRVRVGGRPHGLRQVHAAERRRRAAGTFVGQVRVFGEPLAGINRRAGYMFQTEALMPWRSALDNVMAGPAVPRRARCRGAAQAQAWLRGWAWAALATATRTSCRAACASAPALAQTLALDPDIILMDEPFSALDIQTRQLMENEVLELWAGQAKAVLFITHDLDEAIAMSDRVVVLSAGPATHGPSANL